ncbi:MAG: ABC transporter permease [Armatimonadota bacterium]|nr:ABC transporter permease [Armatimonadota bacterium]MDW8155682.1 ABC transporter permease [Armatimonadota bacterium]
MARFVARRLVSLGPVLFGVTVLVFLVLRLIPGDVIEVYAGTQVGLTPEQRRELERIFGMDRPLYRQYVDWIAGVLQGDLGTSLRTGRKVGHEIATRLPVSAELATLATGLAMVVGLPLGMLAATQRGRAWDAVARVAGLMGLSLPGFWLATLLVLVFSKYLPVGLLGPYVRPTVDPLANLRVLALPTVALATPLAAVLMRYVRASLVEVLGQEYIRTARSKGLPERVVLRRHALRNALIPVVTVVGIQFGYLLGGTVVVEEVFGIPGMGRLVLYAIYQRDYPVVQAVVLVSALLFVGVNLAVDVLYAFLDPRIRYG